MKTSTQAENSHPKGKGKWLSSVYSFHIHFRIKDRYKFSIPIIYIQTHTHKCYFIYWWLYSHTSNKQPNAVIKIRTDSHTKGYIFCFSSLYSTSTNWITFLCRSLLSSWISLWMKITQETTRLDNMLKRQAVWGINKFKPWSQVNKKYEHLDLGHPRTSKLFPIIGDIGQNNTLWSTF